MKNRTVIRLISYSTAVCLLGFGFFFKEKSKTARYATELQNERMKNLNQLESSLNNITETLNKTAYLENGTDLVSMSTKLFAEGEMAKNALADLPGGTRNAETLYKFLSQVGNYSASISKTAMQEGSITPKQSDMMLKLFDISKNISKSISEINNSYDNAEDFAKIIDKNVKESGDIKNLAKSLDGLEESLGDYPTLIYDGPFSDHILEKKPLMTSNATTFSKEECKKRAAEIFSINAKKLKYDGMQKGKIECYRFSYGDFTCCMTKKGGYIEYMRKSREVSGNNISSEKAIKIAQDFMGRLSVKNMQPTYFYSDEGVCVINFAYMSGDTLCYTDLIKVGVALDNGEIMLLEAGGYLANHTSRPFDELKHTADEARAKVSKKLSIISEKLCLIPTDSGNEVRCYEFLCETKEKQQILVYVTVKNLNTADILLLEKSDAGTLVK